MSGPVKFSFVLVVALLFGSTLTFAQSARDYYNELYKAGGLDRMADGYVCFDDDPKLETIFIFGKSETLKQFLISTGEFKKMSKAQQAELNHGFLNTRGYDKGVPQSVEETYSADGTSWTTDPGIISGQKMRMRLSIEWTTLRYRRSVEFLNPNGTLKSVPISRYGRCEEVSPDIRQKGNP
ncbi:hypothetical protein [Alloacidobacterium sp.]|uniref:hypothetical protein n=1 Tax=Alloacidobacterium sp. TaxID=2951999 RepID=UPI002D58ED63|nr:hypothetical protein [Alloacidobacterium sp.]HYK36887.1 hypothetical protein [Alloacidobacterium sp.]